MAIDTSYLLSTHQTKQASKQQNGSYLGKDAFMKILITQLQNQDINNTMDDKEFIAQMAQFSSLEQMSNMTSAIEAMAQKTEQNQLVNYMQFVGKEVTWHKLDKNSDVVSEGKGVVKSIGYVDDSALFTLEDGSVFGPENISAAEDSTLRHDLLSASQMIGKLVNWVEDGQEKAARVSAVSLKDGSLVYQMDNDRQSKITAGQIAAISV
ncbi:MAG: flagellar hook capping FlgD N-terminal domain-containing protein [Bacillus sp. (in: firmicutes)]